MEKLEEMFELQEKLNNLAFQSNDITNKEGKILCVENIKNDFFNNRLGPNDHSVEWVKNYCLAMKKEIEEAEELLPWKWWSKETIGEKAFPNLSKEQRVKMLQIELIDILHFLLSAMICTGMNAEQVHDLYVKKLKVNIERQINNYNTANKTEEDNINLTKN